MSVVAPPQSEKQLAAQALDRMPESVSLEQICEELGILAAIRKGEQAAAEGRVVPHEEVKLRSAMWTGK